MGNESAKLKKIPIEALAIFYDIFYISIVSTHEFRETTAQASEFIMST